MSSVKLTHLTYNAIGMTLIIKAEFMLVIV